MQAIKLFLLINALACYGLLVQAESHASTVPNVILIMTDDQGYGDIGAHGNPWLQTPEMDRLFHQGVRLEDFHVDPTCSPSRGALMSGKYASRVGVWLTYGSRHHVAADELSMADIFQQNGYATAMFGKWHLGDNYPYRPMDRGFETSLIHGGGMVGETPDFWDNDYYDDVYLRNGKPERVAGYCTDVWFDEAIAFVKKSQDKPFFLYVAPNAPHGPLFVPEAYAKPYKEQGVPHARSLFFGMISSIDENMGRLRRALMEEGLWENTILIFMNDNGTAQGASFKAGNGRSSNSGWVVDGYNAGMRGKKGSVFEGGHRVACFLHWPQGRVVGGRGYTGLTAHIDLLPTLVDLCELRLNKPIDFDGISLKPFLMEADVPAISRTILVHHQGRFGSRIEDGLLIYEKNVAVMRDRWRLVGKQLFDLDHDPEQRRDVAAAYPDLVRSLRAEYEAWWREISVADDRYYPFWIDPDKQHTVLISSQNLMGASVAYNHQHVRAGTPIERSFAMIDVKRPGRYRITVRRWPRELDLSMDALLEPLPLVPERHYLEDFLCTMESRALPVCKAALSVGSFSDEQPVVTGDREVVFEVELAAGEQRIESVLTLEDGSQTAAYFMYIEPTK